MNRIQTLQPDLFFSLATCHNLVESTSQRYLRYSAFTESQLLPRLSMGTEAFYDPATGRLDPAFAVHMDLLRTLRNEVASVLERAHVLHASVGEELERLR